jgi:hypothetical protein
MKYVHGKNNYELIIENNSISVFKNEKKAYTIDRMSCSCSGFGYNRKCNHFDKAKESGLLDHIQEKQKSGTHFFNSEWAKKHRENSIRTYNKTQNKNWDEIFIQFLIKEMPKYVIANKTLENMEEDYKNLVTA